MTRAKIKSHHLLRDLGVIVLSILVALLLAKSGIIESLVEGASHSRFWSIFVAGFFFTAAFTTAPAIVALGEIAKLEHPILVALIGAAGAMLGDMIIFRFIRDSLIEDLRYLFQFPRRSRWAWIFHLRLFHWLLPFAGALIIASPLPDELGITLIGLSKTKGKRFLLISFVFNFLGILMIGAASRLWF